MGEDDIYNTNNKCQYTGLPIYGDRCSCFIHSKQYNTNYFQTSKKVRACGTLKRSNSHEILQIYPPVTEEEVKSAYRKLCLVHHPDKGGKNDDFIKLNNAYQELLCY
tara:strand:- start:65 stop:385 length:321 start_codon:yes stop_codon:yes gene_type:complete